MELRQDPFDHVANIATGASFEETNWWVIKKAGQPTSSEADSARDSFCQLYWGPVFDYVRRSGYSLEDSQDLTQSFFAHVLDKNYIQSATREKGKFRSFLLTLLKRFLADDRDRTDCQKRGGGRKLISLDSGDTEFRSRIEPADELTPDKIFERTWTNGLLRYVLTRLREEMAAEGKEVDFEQLEPLVTSQSEHTYAEVGQRLLWTEANVKVTVHRLRRRLGELLRSEIAKTATTTKEVEEEIRDLFSAFT